MDVPLTLILFLGVLGTIVFSAVASGRRSKSWGVGLATVGVVSVAAFSSMAVRSPRQQPTPEQFIGSSTVTGHKMVAVNEPNVLSPSSEVWIAEQVTPTSMTMHTEHVSRFGIILFVPLIGLFLYLAMRNRGSHHTSKQDFSSQPQGHRQGSGAWPWIGVALLPLFYLVLLNGTRTRVSVGEVVESPVITQSVPRQRMHTQQNTGATASNYKYAPVQEYQFIEHGQPADTEDLWEQITKSRIELAEEEIKKESHAKNVEQVAAEVSDPKDTSFELISTEVKRTKRPDWVENPPQRIGNVYREVLSSDPYKTVTECHRQLDSLLNVVIQERIKQLTAARHVPGLHRMGMGLDYIFREVCQEEWIEVVDASFGEMKRVHLLLEFDKNDDKKLKEVYLRYQRSDVIQVVAIVFGLILVAIALVYGLLKVDTWTRGYYSKRLFFGVPAAIILVMVLIATIFD